MRKKTVILLFLLISILAFSNLDIDNIVETNFGIEINVGLLSFGYPQKIYLKSIGGVSAIQYNGSEIVVFENEVLEISYKNNKLYLENDQTDKVVLKKADILSTWALSKDGQSYRKYRGEISIYSENIKNGILLVNNVFSEEYLYSVVACEIDSDNNEDAVKAQAVAARTYLYKTLEDKKYSGLYDITDTTMDQVYKGIDSETERTNKYVNDTANEIITYLDEPIFAFYHGNSGGYTASIEDVWMGSKPMPYLKAIDDSGNWESFPRAAWTYKIPKSELSKLFKYNISKVYVEEKKDMRVKTVVISGEKETKLFGGEFRKILGYTNLPSTFFDITQEGEYILINGRGSGHGVGMSQWGAIELARKGYNYLEILKYYYTGVEIKNVEKTQKYAIIKDNFRN